MAGDPRMIQDPDLPLEIPLGHPRVELVRLRIVEEQGAPIAPEDLRRDLQQRLELPVEILRPGHALRDPEQDLGVREFLAGLLR